MNDGPVYIVDDDADDQDFIKEIWQELGYANKLVFFKNGDEVLNHFKNDSTVPFLIICDVNLPRMDGFELKERVLETDALYYKSIPFVFWSAQASKEQIKKAYDLRINGFFVKENRLEDLKKSFYIIVEYWMRSRVPM